MEKIIRGGLYYCNLDPIKGSEQGGLRPVLVIQNDLANENSSTTIIAPITKQGYTGKRFPTHVLIKQFNEIRPKSIVLLEQIRVVDKSRFTGFINVIDNEDMIEIENAIKISLGL